MKRQLRRLILVLAPLMVAAALVAAWTGPPAAPCSSGYTDKVIKKYNDTCRLFDTCMLWKAGKIVAMPHQQYKAVLTTMRNWWNGMVGNSWAKVGPRYLNFGVEAQGNIISPSTRLFYSVMPSHTNSRTVRLTHVDGKSRAVVNVCVVDPETGRPTSAKTWDIARKSSTGKVYQYTIRNVSKQFVFVDIAGKTATRSFKYKLSVN